MAMIDFEHCNRETNVALSNWFDFYQTSSVSADNSGPFGYGRYLIPNDTAPTGRAMATQSTVWMQGHVFQPTPAGGNQSFYCLRDSGNVQVMLRMDPSGRLQLYRGGSLIFTTVDTVFALNAWYFVQMRAVIHGTTGSVSVYVNGVSVLTFSGNTSATGLNTCNEWGVFASNSTRHANMMLYNESGNVPNSQTPETRIFADMPTGNGVVNQFLPLSGASWDNLKEQPSDSDTTYVSAAAAPASDLYAFPSATVPAGCVVYAVANEYTVRKDDGGSNNIDALMYSAGSVFAANEIRTLTATYQRWRSFWDVDPSGGAAWTVARANASQVGFKRVV